LITFGGQHEPLVNSKRNRTASQGELFTGVELVKEGLQVLRLNSSIRRRA